MLHQSQINLDDRLFPYDPNTFFCVCIHTSVTDPNAKRVYYLEVEGKLMQTGVTVAIFADKQEIQYYKGHQDITDREKRLYLFTAVLHEAKFYDTLASATQATHHFRDQFPDNRFSIKSVMLEGQ